MYAASPERETDRVTVRVGARVTGRGREAEKGTSSKFFLKVQIAGIRRRQVF